jgi:hypothetical protein
VGKPYSLHRIKVVNTGKGGKKETTDARFKVGEGSGVELLVVDKTANAAPLETDRLLLQSVEDAKVSKNAAEVGCDLGKERKSACKVRKGPRTSSLEYPHQLHRFPEQIHRW